MCIAPVPIPNKNCGFDVTKGLNRYKDCSSRFLYVPCGHCIECIRNKSLSIVQRSQMMSKNWHLFFGTLTYNDDMIPRLLTSSGFEYRFADTQDFRNMFKRVRKYNVSGRKLKYCAVSERGGRFARPHFHFILFVHKNVDDSFLTCKQLESYFHKLILENWCRCSKGNQYSTKRIPLCDYIHYVSFGKLRSTYDFHYVDSALSGTGESDVAFYVTKYLFKDDTNHEQRVQQALRLNLEPEEYESTWKLVRSKTFFSKNFGDPDSPEVSGYVRSCIEKSKSQQQFNFPLYYDPVTGKSFPLSKYYRSKSYTLDDCIYFYNRSQHPYGSNVLISDDTYQEKIQRYEQNTKKKDDLTKKFSNSEIL